MAGFLTVCFSDWTSERFCNGVMRIVDGRRTNDPIRRPLRADEVEGIDYYIKPDPDFCGWAYRRCHRQLRQQLQAGDVLFFRTLWRGRQFLIGYLTISAKDGDPNDPACLADPDRSLLSPGYIVPITEELVLRLNPRAVPDPTRNFNMWVNENLGRNYLRLDAEQALFLRDLLDSATRDASMFKAIDPETLLRDPSFEADGWSPQQTVVWQEALGIFPEIFDNVRGLAGRLVTVGNIFLAKALFYGHFAERLVASLAEATSASEGAPSHAGLEYVRFFDEKTLRANIFKTAGQMITALRVPDPFFLFLIGFDSEADALREFIPSLKEEVLDDALAGKLTLGDLARRQPYVIMRLQDEEWRPRH